MKKLLSADCVDYADFIGKNLKSLLAFGKVRNGIKRSAFGEHHLALLIGKYGIVSSHNFNFYKVNKNMQTLLKSVIALVLTSCSMSEVMEIEEPRMQADTTEYTPIEKGKRPPPHDHDHDKKVPISFDVDVDDWGDEEEIPVEE